MKHLTLYKTALAVLLPTFLLFSCKKEEAQPTDSLVVTNNVNPVMHTYKDTTILSYSYMPYETKNGLFKPDISYAWYAATGTGTGTGMNTATCLSNLYVSYKKDGISTIAAPVIQFFQKQLILDALLHVPENVSSINYDTNGSSIWFQLDPGSSTQLNGNKLEFSGTSTIVGGTGIFNSAKGSVITSGYFNLLDVNDAGIGNRGYIWY